MPSIAFATRPSSSRSSNGIGVVRSCSAMRRVGCARRASAGSPGGAGSGRSPRRHRNTSARCSTLAQAALVLRKIGRKRHAHEHPPDALAVVFDEFPPDDQRVAVGRPIDRSETLPVGFLDDADRDEALVVRGCPNDGFGICRGQVPRAESATRPTTPGVPPPSRIPALRAPAVRATGSGRRRTPGSGSGKASDDAEHRQIAGCRTSAPAPAFRPLSLLRDLFVNIPNAPFAKYAICTRQQSLHHGARCASFNRRCSALLQPEDRSHKRMPASSPSLHFECHRRRIGRLSSCRPSPCHHSRHPHPRR